MKRIILGVIGLGFDIWGFMNAFNKYTDMKTHDLIEIIPNPDDWLRGELIKWAILFFVSGGLIIWGWATKPKRNRSNF